jgi:hypothetical protein
MADGADLPALFTFNGTAIYRHGRTADIADAVSRMKPQGMRMTKPWPVLSEYMNEINGDRAGYQFARAEAAMERLKVAVEALGRILTVSEIRCAIKGGEYATHHEDYVGWSRKALAAIGPLPEGE